MSRLLSTEPVAVRIGDCECPDAPHTEGDMAHLRPRLTPPAGIAATTLINEATDAIKLNVELGMLFLTDGLLRWDLLDDEGDPVPCDGDTLRGGAISWDETLLPIADRAAELYTESVLRPFRPAKASSSSRAGRTRTRGRTSATSKS